MAIETLEDIVEDVANQLGIYGVHGEEEECDRKPTCRVCFTSSIKRRILAAMEIERKLNGDAHER